jgi:hypothetical protein
MDMTDRVKGHRQYWLRLHAAARALAGTGLRLITICQASAAVMPHLCDEASEIRFLASGCGVVSAGPNLKQAQAHVVAGGFNTSSVTLELATPRQEPIVQVFAAAHVRSSSPPDPEVKYQIELSVNGGKSWQPIVKDWTISRRGEEPRDFWSQSMCWGSAPASAARQSKVQVRFRNNGGKNYARAEAHLVYQCSRPDVTKVTFAWSDDKGTHQATHNFTTGAPPWQLTT